jgi:hypothetical protein
MLLFKAEEINILVSFKEHKLLMADSSNEYDATGSDDCSEGPS